MSGPFARSLRVTRPAVLGYPGAALALALMAALSGERDLDPPTEGIRGARIQALIAASDDSDWTVRWDAVNELGSSKDRRAVPALVRRALHDDNAHPRWRSLWALRTVDPTGLAAVPPLRTALHEGDRVVARNAAVALAFFGRAEGRAELLGALEDRRSFRRWEAVYSLGAIGGREVAEELVRLLQRGAEPDAKVRGQAVLTLGRVGGRQAVPALLRALRDDESPDVRWRAAVALTELGGPSITGDLARVLRTEADPRVRDVVQGALLGARSFIPPTRGGS